MPLLWAITQLNKKAKCFPYGEGSCKVQQGETLRMQSSLLLIMNGVEMVSQGTNMDKNSLTLLSGSAALDNANYRAQGDLE